MTTKPPPIPLDGPVSIVIGALAGPLTDLIGISGLHGATLTITPATVDPQWYVDNSTITAENEAVWWTLSKPERIILTRKEIKDVARELTEMRTKLKTDLGLERQKVIQGKTKDRASIATRIPELAAQIESTELLIRTLRKTATELELLHARLKYKYDRPAGGI